jgi:hypothetical protein
MAKPRRKFDARRMTVIGKTGPEISSLESANPDPKRSLRESGLSLALARPIWYQTGV